MKINFADLQAQYSAYQSEIDAAIKKVLISTQFIMGPEVVELEAALTEFVGCHATISCANGTEALQLILMALDLQPGDEVITSPFSFIAAAEIIALLKLKPVFVDIEKDTYNIDAHKIAEKITPKTKAIIPISLYGQTADMDKINAVASHFSELYHHPIYVIEDAAQSFGATYKNRRSGNLSPIASTSFFPSKPLGCYGDGGAIFINEDSLVKKIASLRVHGQTARYIHSYIGTNGRLDTLQAAILLVKLKYFDKEITARQQIAARYDALLAGASLILPKVAQNCTSVFAQYSICVENREHVLSMLKEAGVPTAVHYPIPLHLQTCFRDLGHQKGDFPVAEHVAEQILSLPMSAFLTEAQQDYIVASLRKALYTFSDNYS